MATYPLATLAAQVTATGITAPPFSDIYNSLIASYQLIFGSDSYIDPDSQDGQWIALMARSISDANDMAIAVYNSYSPATAQGSALSSVVKVNGITRDASSYSQVNVLITGVVGAVLNYCSVKDLNGNLWDLPPSVTIPPAGSITVTAICQTPGAITAAASTVTGIQTPTLGWQSVTNIAAATPGAPVEADPALRQRQTQSVALPSLSNISSVVAGLQALPGVTQVVSYENYGTTTDSNGLPAKSISLVVSGGVTTDIASTILRRKASGCSTYGTTNVSVPDQNGNPRTINYFTPVQELITVAITLHPLSLAYTTAIGAEIIAAVVAYINALPIGTPVYRDRLFMPAQLFGAADSLTYNITALNIALSPGTPAASDVAIPFNGEAHTTAANVTITLI